MHQELVEQKMNGLHIVQLVSGKFLHMMYHREMVVPLPEQVGKYDDKGDACCLP